MKRFVLNIAMLVVILLIMGFHFIPQLWHEILGLVLLAGALWHLGLNRKWFSALTRGKWHKLRGVQTLLAILLTVLFLTATVTGIIISNHVFRSLWTGVALHRSIFVHQLHVTSAYMMVILGGMHIGMHWQSLWQRIKKLPLVGSLEVHPQVRFWVLTVIGWLGVLYARLDHVGDKLIMKHIFGTAASHLPIGGYYVLLLCMVGLYAIAFYHLQKYLRLKMDKTGGAGR